MPKSYILKLSDTQKKELNRFMKSTRDKEEYRRRASSAIKQKMERIPYRTIAKNLGVNYRNGMTGLTITENMMVWME